MADTSKRPKGLFGLAQDAAAAKRTKKRFDNLCRSLSVPTKGPDWYRWALVGIKLACEQPEFIEPLRGRGRPKLTQGWQHDEDILREVSDLQCSAGFEFKRALDEVLKSSDLGPADRTTHKKRLRRLHKRQHEASVRRIAEALMAPGRKIRRP